MVEVELPRLADRKHDFPLLERHFVSRFAAQYRKQIRGLTRRAQIRLSQHTWPGNVREFENVIGHAAMMTMSDMIDVEDLPPYLQEAAGHTAETYASSHPVELGALEEHERMLLKRALEASSGNQSKAARMLRIGRHELRYKMKKHNLDAPDSGKSSAASA